MAADGLNRVKLRLVECDKAHDVTVELPYEEAGDVLTVAHMSREFERVTGIATTNQRIIFKYKVLDVPTRSLVSCGIKDGSEIHLLKHHLRPHDRRVETRLQDIEADLSATNQKLSKIISEADAIHRGYNARAYHTRSFHALRARLQDCSRELSQHQESVHAVDTQRCEPHVLDNKRKLTRLIETLQYRIEGLDNGIRDVIARIDEQHGMQMSVAFGRWPFAR